MTTWVDGSAVYGSDKEAQESLRDDTKRGKVFFKNIVVDLWGNSVLILDFE